MCEHRHASPEHQLCICHTFFSWFVCQALGLRSAQLMHVSYCVCVCFCGAFFCMFVYLIGSHTHTAIVNVVARQLNIAYTHYSNASYKSLMVTSSLSLSSYRPLCCVHTYLQIRILSRAIPESTARKRTQHPSERRKWQRHYQRQHIHKLTHTRSDDNENGKEFSSHSRVDRCTFDDVALVAWRAFNSEWDLTDFQVKGI